MKSEELLKQLIQSQYGNLAKFSEESGVPYTTIRNIFSRGIDGVGVGTVIKICKTLNVDVESLVDGQLSLRPNQQKVESWRLYANKKELTPIPESELDKEAKEVAEAYKIANQCVRLSVRKYLGLDAKDEDIQVAARKSDKQHSATGQDTDVEI